MGVLILILVTCHMKSCETQDPSFNRPHPAPLDHPKSRSPTLVARTPQDSPESRSATAGPHPHGMHVGLWKLWQMFNLLTFPRGLRNPGGGSRTEQLLAPPQQPWPRCVCRHLVTALQREGQFEHYLFII